ncbi:hypothetical protein TVAG_366100 [Trichomonas vaginalis G3]|uniref:Uncharacterized protein n=1 Tax=Trichomonas vaginalis (strain ATCC PRA-98 / G3) TaxID=412133 RepID=A2DHQ4_TRIV3|nr:hypothetical protein TVAGG3_0303150 [Trichomonas vaginalis G3]EAY20102.1 hypothetical protein TVAG_366100 [Trichomonas vaginalis G3]KAI5528055.1 hypothetical protein TVAGG3_0303150 [Trichomonas vaginalis G3]|eukprot:XP_001581088.1 hypothetical protein [Trichomonas vaginalis G3]
MFINYNKKKKVSKRKKKSVSHSSQLPPPQIPPVQANEQTSQPANGDDADDKGNFVPFSIILDICTMESH